MKNNNYTGFILAALFLFIASCSESPEKQADPPPQDSVIQKKDTVTKDTLIRVESVRPSLTKDERFDAIASIIAGKNSGNQDYHTVENTECWKQYVRFVDSSWARVDAIRFSKMREWAKTECADANNSTRDLFYPFSGPDFLNAFILFPNAKTYYLLALEPTGAYPDLRKFDEQATCNYFGHVVESLQDILKKSYFITRKMNVAFQANNVDGVLPILSLFLKRTGNEIINVNRVAIDSLGNTVETAYDSASVAKGRPKGLRIDFYAKGNTGDIRTVYYYSCDLIDNNFNDKKRFYTYLNNSIGEVNTYLKSASYILHYKNFSNVRNIILEKSKFILQDDTGIALRYLDLNKWNVQLYGKYVKPVKDFDGVYQTDLKQLYSKDSLNIKPLPFDLGYHWGTKDNNLMRFIKK